MARPMRTPEVETSPDALVIASKLIGFFIPGLLQCRLSRGLDKFFHLLVDWTQYLAPIVPRLTGINAATFMMIVGVVEIVAGIVVAVKPKCGGLLVAAWL
jgi:hypothetical protein